jgi:hypothetical protein
MQAFVLADPRFLDDHSLRVALLDEKEVPQELEVKVRRAIRTVCGEFLTDIKSDSVELIAVLKKSADLVKLSKQLADLLDRILVTFFRHAATSA